MDSRIGRRTVFCFCICRDKKHRFEMALPSVSVYTTSTAISLKVKKDQQAAKFLLEKKGCLFDEFDIARDPEAKETVRSKYPGSALPVIVIHRQPPLTFTYDELQTLEEDDQLAPLLL